MKTNVVNTNSHHHLSPLETANLFANRYLFAHRAVIIHHPFTWSRVSGHLVQYSFSLSSVCWPLPTPEGNIRLFWLLNSPLCSPASCKLFMSAVWCWTGGAQWVFYSFFGVDNSCLLQPKMKLEQWAERHCRASEKPKGGGLQIPVIILCRFIGTSEPLSHCNTFLFDVHYRSKVWGHPDNFVSSMKTHFY